MTYLTIERVVKAYLSRTKTRLGDIMKNLIGVLALALARAGGQERPDWAFRATTSAPPPPPCETRGAPPPPPGPPPSTPRARADKFYDPPTFSQNISPPMPAIVQYGNKEKQVRAC